MAIWTFKDEADVPDDLKKFAEKDGENGFKVNVGPKATVTEFRENNQKLQNEKDELITQLGALKAIIGDDADEFTAELEALRETNQQVADGKLKGNKDVESEITRRTEAMKVAHEAKLAEVNNHIGVLEGKVKEQDTKIYRSELAQYIRSEANRKDIGIEPSAMDYIIADAQNEFEKDDNGNFIRKVDGKVQLGEDGYSPQTGNEWLLSRKESTPIFFKGSSGGEASGESGSGKYAGFSQKDFMALSPAQKLEAANNASKA